MNEVTAEMIERGRGGDVEPSAEKRRLASRIRTAREKLTSSGSRVRTFDLELLRLYAERRCGATPMLALFALGTAGMALIWVKPFEAAAWLLLVLAAVALNAVLATRFLRRLNPEMRPSPWQRRFMAAETAHGAAWASIVLTVMAVEDPTAQVFLLFVLLLVGAMTAMLGATVPVVVFAGLVPTAAAVVSFMRPVTHVQSLPLLVVVGGAQLYFVVLARQLYHAALDTLSIQAEKDELIVELEQSRLNSDEARRRAEEASLAKSRFLATMSHELRTPLNAILGFSEVMKGELFGPHSVPNYKEYSADIHSSGQHLLMLINEILDLSRVEAGRYELNEEAIVLPHLVDECRHLLALRAGKREIEIRELIEPDLPRIWGDERALRQVVLNLLSNAIKFTPQNGLVTIKVGWTAQGGQYVSIRDTGPGIPDAEIPIVMSSFGRGSLAQKNAEEGSGLGLPIVKGLVELHGGSFLLRSKVREGTEAIVILPPERVMDALPHLEPGEPRADPRPRRRVRHAA